MTSTKYPGKMPLTQEKRLDSNFSNNNDHNYLHKKFKKKASTISVFPAALSKTGDHRQKETIVTQIDCNVSIPNGSIAAAHPEIEKIKKKQEEDNLDVQIVGVGKHVQTNFNNENTSLSNLNNIIEVSGQTSFTDEFSYKTENHENDFIKETYIGPLAGRYICPYCKLSCAKPSVLQKHIRAHTNERPYPCVPCGFAFKTKSNLYKHRRSRTHALRLQGADVTVTLNDEDLSGSSESDTPTSMSETGSDVSSVRLDNYDSNKYSPDSPEPLNDNFNVPCTRVSLLCNESYKSKTIYKPKFRVGAAFCRDSNDKDKLKKSMSPNADFLTEHISKIISDNEAIIDVIETPLQKKYSKIKQIAESKQFMTDIVVEIKSEPSPLNLTKSNQDLENSFRKRSHSESFSQIDHQKHPLNPEGSIIKDLLLKTKMNGLASISGELLDGSLFVCPLCQIVYRSSDNLETHRLYYCKGLIGNNNTTNERKDTKIVRPENVYLRSNSINVRLPETSSSTYVKTTASTKSSTSRIKPDNLIITKPESCDIIAPLPSPGPLLGNTRLVDTRIPNEYIRKHEHFKIKSTASPKRRIDCSSDMYSPRVMENISPRSGDMYSHPKIRCIETNSGTFRSIDEMTHMRNNSTSLQMFGGEVKIMDHSGSTTTLRIEPNKNQLSPIIIQQNLSPSKMAIDAEASSIVVRSGLHSGGTIMHNPPTPKEVLSTPQPQTPRISISTPTVISNSNLPNIHDISRHFQFPPLSAITAFNPLTLPPLSPSSSPNGATTIFHGGKLIPHVPGIPGPNTPGVFVGNTNALSKNVISEISKSNIQSNVIGNREDSQGNLLIQSPQIISKYETHRVSSSRSPNLRLSQMESEKPMQNQDAFNTDLQQYSPSIPIIRIKNVEDAKTYSPNIQKQMPKQDLAFKRNSDGVPKSPALKDNINSHTYNKLKIKDRQDRTKNMETKIVKEVRNFNFENLITKAEIYNNQISSSLEVQNNTNAEATLPVSVQNERSETSYFQKSVMTKSNSEDRKPKFLRPTTLPLKPGTFTPKRHHGITPNANTMPLVSPETPRPAKAYGQLYLNGNAYTYLGLKCSTKVFYCTINRPQPTYVPNQHFLSMYSNWQLLSELTPDPLGLSASSAMSLYDSRHRPQNTAVSIIKQDLIFTHSSQWNKGIHDNKQNIPTIDMKKFEDNRLHHSDNLATPKKELAGGFESNEEYTYVRGRGRGRYVCSECGIRCKKPSMLKKHIRTHTDVRPYTCIHCAFSFKTKGNLTKHMKSKAHYKKCCELGINPNEGNDIESGELAQCSGETDDDTDSDGDEGNEGETESSDTEMCKSRLPEHEAAHCLLSLGGPRPTTSATPGLITSARPSTYPYSPTSLETTLLEISTDRLNLSRHSSNESSMDTECEPIDLSKGDVKTTNIPEIPTARESSVLASLASNTAKLPNAPTQWANGEPMLHTYLTERALLDSKIKQSQLTSSTSKLKNVDLNEKYISEECKEDCVPRNIMTPSCPPQTITLSEYDLNNRSSVSKEETIIKETEPPVTICSNGAPDSKKANVHCNTNAENAKYVVSEYLKHARINLIKSQEDTIQNQNENIGEENHILKSSGEENINPDDINISDSDSIKLPSMDHDAIATKVVIGVGGVAFKVTKGKDFENSTYSQGRLMEDGRRVCDFCNKTFTKPSQLRLHLNIHYMERPFRCGVCAVSFRTRGHLQKHERSGSHHNKVSMTSTFGAATSFNPRPFRCSDCNIAFRIHGHLAKHLRSKMHVMRLECLFKLPFGTFTEIERAGVSLTDIDTTDCASSLASLQTLARKLHEKDPSKLEYREPNEIVSQSIPAGRDHSEDEDNSYCDNLVEGEKDSDTKSIENSEEHDIESRASCSATDI